GLDVVLGRSAVGEVAGKRMCPAAVAGELDARRFERGLAARADRDPGPGHSKAEGDLAPDAAAGTGDDTALALEVENHVSARLAAPGPQGDSSGRCSP